MKSSPNIIQLTAPLREVRLAGPTPVHQPIDAASQDRWQASYELGRIEGEKALSEQLLKQRADTHELMNGLLNSLRTAVPQVIRETENMVVTLALEVAQKLVAELPISVAMVEAAVRDALTQVERTAQLTVRLHPADLELLNNAASPVLTSGEGSAEFRFLASSEISRGGCMVQTQFGTVDARRETKLDLIKQNLLT